MCPACSQFIAVAIETSRQLEDLLVKLRAAGIQEGVLSIEVGDLQR